jgi:hypothetical protein
MSDESDSAKIDPRQSSWAAPVSKLKAATAPGNAINLNVEGRELVGPLQGFGQLWQKTYWVRLEGASQTPQQVVAAWKENFPRFWPAGNYFYSPLTGLAPGEVALLNLSMPGGMPLSTGMMVLYVDDTAFTLMTPQGHMESGFITFSAYEQDGVTVAQVESLARANDPMYEIGFMMFAHRRQEAFWHQTLAALAAHFGAQQPEVKMRKACIDTRWQWREARNVWHNAAMRTGLYLAATPVRWVGRALKR